MKVLFLLALAGLSQALDSECIEGEFLSDGYTTGQNIELNYQGTQMQLADNGNTEIQIGFLVPKVYSEQYQASAMTISFNRDMPQGAPGKDAKIGQVTNNDMACFTNYLSNSTECSQGLNSGVWRNDGPMGGESQCVDYMYATVAWEDAITNEAFGNVEFTDDGENTRVYMAATVETWRTFNEGRDVVKHEGQMTGDQQLDTNFDSKDRTGKYWGDGGDLDVDFGNLEIDDWRYTFYQIPFYMVFPKTVVVETDFVIGSPITVLNGVVEQDVVTVNLNPVKGGDRVHGFVEGSGPNFARLDVSITTEVQYPYSIRSPQHNVAPMTIKCGSDGSDNCDDIVSSINFVKWDDPGSCGGNQEGQICQQTFTMRLTPSVDSPCTVAGDYFLEFWAECLVEELCGMGTNNDDPDYDTRKESSGYFSMKFTVDHQDFCPQVMDTVHVAVDLAAYHDEAFSDAISNDWDGSRTNHGGNNAKVVFTNDIIYYEATYRTASEKSGLTVENNQGGSPGNDDIIDYVRAVKIFADVKLGINKDGDQSDGWDGSDWKENVHWSLGGYMVPGEDIVALDGNGDPEETVSGALVLQVPTNQPGDHIAYRIIQCEVEYIDPAIPIRSGVKPNDCFTAPSLMAEQYMDFTKIVRAKTQFDSDENVLDPQPTSIDENEVGFAMRMDERVIPVGPKTDNSHVTVTLESEVYYKGNEQPTRRLLQVDPSVAPLRRQTHSKSVKHGLYYKPETLEMCQLDNNLETTSMSITLDFDKNEIPEIDTVNNWALNLKARMEKHLSVENVFTVTGVESCDKKGCSILIDEIKERRRQEKSGIVKVNLTVVSEEFSTAGQLVNTMKGEIATRKFTIRGAEVTHIDTPDCDVEAPPSLSKLASSSFAVSALVSFAVALFASL